MYISDYMYAVLTEPQSASDSPGPGVTDGCEPPCGCWDRNPSLVEDAFICRHVSRPCVVLFVGFLFLFVLDKVSLCNSPGCPGT